MKKGQHTTISVLMAGTAKFERGVEGINNKRNVFIYGV